MTAGTPSRSIRASTAGRGQVPAPSSPELPSRPGQADRREAGGGPRGLGIETVADLVMHYPRRYVDRTRQSEVAELQLGEESVIVAEVTSGRGTAGPAAGEPSSSST